MTQNFYAIYDTKAQVFQRIFHEYNDATAVRTIAAMVNDESKGNLFHENAEDFQLFKIGYFDQNTGEFTNEQKQLIKLFELLRVKEMK